MLDELELLHRLQVYAFVSAVLFFAFATTACAATWAVLKYAVVPG